MKILILSWEFFAEEQSSETNNICNISDTLSTEGNEVHVITNDNINSVFDNESDAFIHRINRIDFDGQDITTEIMDFNFHVIKMAGELIKYKKFDLIIANDWQTAYSAKSLNMSFNIPIVCTIFDNNSIEEKQLIKRYVYASKWMLAHNAGKIIVFTEKMKNKIHSVYSISREKIMLFNCHETGKDNFWNQLVQEFELLYNH